MCKLEDKDDPPPETPAAPGGASQA